MARLEAREMEAERPHKTLLASVGTCGFSYRDWKGILYPEWLPARDGACSQAASQSRAPAPGQDLKGRSP